MSENAEKNRKLGKAFLGAALLFLILILATAAAGAISYRGKTAATASDAESMGQSGAGQGDAGQSGKGETDAGKTSGVQSGESQSLGSKPGAQSGESQSAGSKPGVQSGESQSTGSKPGAQSGESQTSETNSGGLQSGETKAVDNSGSTAPAQTGDKSKQPTGGSGQQSTAGSSQPPTVDSSLGAEEKEVVLTCQGAEVKITLESSWEEGDDGKETVIAYRFSLKNTGKTVVSDWKIILKTEVTPVSVECWDVDCEWKNGTLTLKAKEYMNSIKAGETCEGVGMNVRMKKGEVPVFSELQVEYQ